ncbi:glycosyltransferase family 87 protein [Cryobacterium sp. CG_9.6]|uniref:glycosyltransferase family 87 protein n=1 Tax=Cryobacterium sp. CG_9.6 TaxID=2760710 RepID=UPI0024772BFD|nr:glycosyltransferase family 87 protein [Cryobacterium sp. CG_9.6]MDH6235981.1 hypothetical protein [Cryobacterium sp. CG_9.6]
MRIVLVSVLLLLSTALTGYTVFTYDNFRPGPDSTALLVCTGLLWLLFALALLALRGVSGRAVVVLVLVGSVALGGAALAGPPNTSTDSARYAWDGIVQNAGISPYAYPPTDDRLDSLRVEWLFPAPVITAGGDAVCPGERIHRAYKDQSGELLCSALNRSDVPTIYPPASEIFFAGVRAITGPGPQYWPLQLAGLLLSVGTTVMLLVGMTRRGIDLRWAAIWAWCPLVATEAVNNSHVDMLGVVFTLAAVFLVSAGQHWRGGIMLGIAIATKLIPVIAAPAMLRHRGWKVIVASIVTFALLYVPYVLATGIGVLGYLPGYLSEEGYQDGSRFALISLFAPGGAAIVVAGVLLVGIALIVFFTTNQAEPWVGQLVMIGSTLLIVSPRYPWYALLLLPFIALSGRWEWLMVPLALSLRLLEPSLVVTQTAMALAAIVIVLVSLRRAGPGATGRLLRAPGAWLGRRRAGARPGGGPQEPTRH